MNIIRFSHFTLELLISRGILLFAQVLPEIGTTLIHMHTISYILFYLFLCSFLWFSVYLFIILFYFFVQYELTIVTSDSLNEAEAKVVIFIRDVNDLPPLFAENTYEATIFEEEIEVLTILQVSFFSSVLFYLLILHAIFIWRQRICIFHHLAKQNIRLYDFRR